MSTAAGSPSNARVQTCSGVMDMILPARDPTQLTQRPRHRLLWILASVFWNCARKLLLAVLLSRSCLFNMSATVMCKIPSVISCIVSRVVPCRRRCFFPMLQLLSILLEIQQHAPLKYQYDVHLANWPTQYFVSLRAYHIKLCVCACVHVL